MSVVVSCFLFCFLSFARSLPSGPCSVRSGRPGRFFMHGIYTLRYACEKRDGRTVCLRMPGVGCRDRAEKDGHGVPPPKRAFYSWVCFPVRVGCVLPACVPVASGTAVVAVTVRRERCRGGRFHNAGRMSRPCGTFVCLGLVRRTGGDSWRMRFSDSFGRRRIALSVGNKRKPKREAVRSANDDPSGISVGNYSVMTKISSTGAAA